jgi:uncharacterized RDD family membrane protein YckC
VSEPNEPDAAQPEPSQPPAGGWQPPPQQQGGVQPPPPPQQGGWQQPPPPPQGGWPQQPPPQGGWQQQPPPQGGWQQQPPPPGGWQQPPPQGGYNYPAAPGYAAPPNPYAGGQPGPGGTVFDPATGLNLPAGTQLASIGRRIGAYFLSLVLVIVTLVIGYIIWGLILWGKGTTPALQVLGMRVYVPGEQKVAGFGRMALREIIGRIVDAIAIDGLVSFILFLATNKRQSLHDMIASTVVLHDPSKVLG